MSLRPSPDMSARKLASVASPNLTTGPRFSSRTLATRSAAAKPSSPSERYQVDDAFTWYRSLGDEDVRVAVAGEIDEAQVWICPVDVRHRPQWPEGAPVLVLRP